MKFAYLTNIQSIHLDETADAQWVHAMSIGNFKHPVHGDLNLTPERSKNFADSVNNRVRGIDPDIDYDHKLRTDEAAGWVKKAEARDDGLWLLVEWTKAAATKIKEKAYRYFSPTYDDEWTDTAGVKHKDVVFGGALTNRPFLKDLVPVNLSELVGDPPVELNQRKEGDGMDPKKLRTMLGLAETATDAEVEVKLKALSELKPPPGPSDPAVLRATLKLPATATDAEVEAALKKLAEPPVLPEGITVEQALAQLAEVSTNPAQKALVELVQSQHEELTVLNGKNKEQRIETKLSELDDMFKGKDFTVPPAVKNHLRYVMMNSPEVTANEIFEQYKKTLDLGLIDLTEKGWARRGTEYTPGQRFEKAVKALMEENKDMLYADAVERVSSENPKLYDEYRDEAFSFRTD